MRYIPIVVLLGLLVAGCATDQHVYEPPAGSQSYNQPAPSTGFYGVFPTGGDTFVILPM